MTKAMLESWVSTTEDRKETLVDLKPIHNSEALNPTVRPHVTNQQMYKEYNWLFGAHKRM